MKMPFITRLLKWIVKFFTIHPKVSKLNECRDDAELIQR